MDKKEVEELLEEHEKQIHKEVEKIEKAEERIEKEESEILSAEKKIIQSLNRRPLSAFFIEPGTTAKELGFFRSIFVRRFSRKQRLLFALIVTFAVVLIWRGIWEIVDIIPFLSFAVVSLIVGILLIWFLQKYTDLH